MAMPEVLLNLVGAMSVGMSVVDMTVLSRHA